MWALRSAAESQGAVGEAIDEGVRGRGVEADAAGATEAFASYAGRVRPALDMALRAYLAGVTDSLRDLPVDVQATVEAVRDLSLRGGKRLRAVLLAAGYEACGGEGGPDSVVMGGVSLELLQAYLLIHDDWMDADDVRRGGPSVPAMVRSHFAGRGVSTSPVDAFAILAGDFAAGLSLDALGQVAVRPERLAAAFREMGRIQRDVVLGQMCDLQGPAGGEAPTEADVERTHALKTGSYTVRGPLALGAHLAGATAVTLQALEAFADPLGVAFQLRDDVLGTFGDPSSTGKPVTGDIRQGKGTGLVAALAALTGEESSGGLLGKVFGRPDASHEDVQAIIEQMVSSGAKRRVEARIESLLQEAMTALDAAPLAPASRQLLRGAALLLGHREK